MPSHLAGRLYRALLHMYSPAFRRRFASGMTQAFDAKLSQARNEGAFSVAVLLAGTCADVMRNGVADRLGQLRLPPGLAQDLRVMLRRMARQPGETLPAVATLAIGIGSVTAIFGLVHAVLLSPLPFPESERILVLQGTISDRPSGLSYLNARDLDRTLQSFQSLSPFMAQSVNLTGVPEPERLRGGFVTSGFFDTVATPPAIGRVFEPRDDERGAEPVVVLSHQTWLRRFGGSSAALSQGLMLNNTAFTVVGVMPEEFRFPLDDVEVWLPAWAHTGQLTRSAHNFFTLGRLRPGATIGAARAEVSAAAAVLESQYQENRGLSIRLEPLQEALTSASRAPLGLLLAMVLVLLMAACVNVAGLKIGTGAVRRREMAMRAALGASRARLMLHIAGEAAVAGVVGALAGAVIAAGAIRLIATTSALDVYGLQDASLNLTVFGFALLSGLVAGTAAGMLPALQWAGLSEASAIGSGSRTTANVGRFRSALVVAQVALAMVTLAAAGLLIRSYIQLSQTAPGFVHERVLTLEYRIPRNKYATSASQVAFHDEVLRHVRSVPGVVDAASVRALPFSGNESTVGYRLSRADTTPRAATFNTVTDRYFATMGIPLRHGRTFDARDAMGSSTVVIVSSTLARRAWPGQDPIGRPLIFTDPDIAATVVGVVGDVRHAALSDTSADAIYAVNAHNPGIFMTLAVRTPGDPLAMADAVRRAVWRVDPNQPMWKIRTLSSLIDDSLARDRFLLRVLLFFALAAALLAGIATYGTVAHTVAERRHEIGIRVALGASPVSVLSLVVRQAMLLTTGGVAAGAMVALALAPALQRFLYGVGSSDPVAFGASSMLLLVASLLACWLPARRALRVDPVVALREA